MFTQVRVCCRSRVTFREKSRLCESKADATKNKKIKTDKELRRPSGKAYFGAGNRTTVTGQYFPPISSREIKRDPTVRGIYVPATNVILAISLQVR